MMTKEAYIQFATNAIEDIKNRIIELHQRFPSVPKEVKSEFTGHLETMESSVNALEEKLRLFSTLPEIQLDSAKKDFSNQMESVKDRFHYLYSLIAQK